jgi:ubiquitin carboxyl-terminal hydrolase 10
VLHPERFLGAGLSMTGREGWVRIDDEIVSDVRPEDVFGAVGRDDRCAYLLFYAQMAW